MRFKCNVLYMVNKYENIFYTFLKVCLNINIDN